MSKSLIAIVGAFLIANPSMAGTSYTEATSKLLEIVVECTLSGSNSDLSIFDNAADIHALALEEESNYKIDQVDAEITTSRKIRLIGEVIPDKAHRKVRGPGRPKFASERSLTISATGAKADVSSEVTGGRCLSISSNTLPNVHVL